METVSPIPGGSSPIGGGTSAVLGGAGAIERGVCAIALRAEERRLEVRRSAQLCIRLSHQAIPFVRFAVSLCSGQVPLFGRLESRVGRFPAEAGHGRAIARRARACRRRPAVLFRVASEREVGVGRCLVLVGVLLVAVAAGLIAVRPRLVVVRSCLVSGAPRLFVVRDGRLGERVREGMAARGACIRFGAEPTAVWTPRLLDHVDTGISA